MGSKTPISKEKREIACEICNLKFQTVQAWRTHKNEQHPEVLKNRDSSSTNSKVENQTSRSSKRLQIKKTDMDTGESKITQEQNSGEKKLKINFMCPKCEQDFPTYFQALKHIQKKHSEDRDGNPVSPNSQDIIKPLRVEQIINSTKHVDSAAKSAPTQDEPIKTNTFFCLGCEGEFTGIGVFNKHVSNMHREGVDSMFFKTSEEFRQWKKVMESQVRMKYLTVNNSLSQKFYTCNYVSMKNDINKTYLCPSMITTKEFASGIQIHYNKNHSGHICPKYEVPDEFSNFVTNKAETTNAFDVLIEEETDVDMYARFKTLMQNISIEASKVSTTKLKNLLDTALQMHSILNSYDEDDIKDDTPDTTLINSKVMTDDQITNALESKQSSARLKRKSESTVSVEVKKKAAVDDSQSKDDENNKNISTENKVYVSPKLRGKLTQNMLSPSFNDSYRQFIGTNETSLETNKPNKETKRKEMIKTKIGQFSPKKKSAITEKDVPKETVQKTRSKTILKPSATNKRPTPFSLIKYYEYEVIEQENDYNILVLKI